MPSLGNSTAISLQFLNTMSKSAVGTSGAMALLEVVAKFRLVERLLLFLSMGKTAVFSVDASAGLSPEFAHGRLEELCCRRFSNSCGEGSRNCRNCRNCRNYIASLNATLCHVQHVYNMYTTCPLISTRMQHTQTTPYSI